MFANPGFSLQAGWWAYHYGMVTIHSCVPEILNNFLKRKKSLIPGFTHRKYFIYTFKSDERIPHKSASTVYIFTGADTCWVPKCSQVYMPAVCLFSCPPNATGTPGERSRRLLLLTHQRIYTVWNSANRP